MDQSLEVNKGKSILMTSGNTLKGELFHLAQTQHRFRSWSPTSVIDMVFRKEDKISHSELLEVV